MSYNAKLYNSIKNFINEKRISFHMPVHGGGEIYDEEFRKNIMAFDVTELDATDNLAAPKGAILHTHENMARLFKAKNAHILVGGSSAGISAMMLSSLKRNDTVLIDRCAHISVINACVLYGFVPVFIEREINKDFGISAPLSVDAIRRAINENPSAKAVLITSPTYYGICSPIDEIADMAHKNNMVLIVDCAHGSHFTFSDVLPLLPTQQGADMCVVSLHKTLGAPTQTALLLHNSEKISFEQVKTCINMVTTTSPSYMLMCAADAICEKMSRDGEKLIKKAIEYAKYAKEKIEKTTKCRCLPKEGGDMSRLVINFSSYEITGEKVAQMLCDKYKIDAEMADYYNVVCIVSQANEIEEIDELVLALGEICSKARVREKASEIKIEKTPLKIEKNISEAFFSDTKMVEIRKSIGHICADTVSIYPPGEVCLVPGAKIEEETVDNIIRASKACMRITGMQDGCIRVVK